MTANPTVIRPSITSESLPGGDQSCLPTLNPFDSAQCLSLSRWFTEEVHPHEAALRNWLRVRFPAISDRDDLIQESFLRVWRARMQGPIVSVKAFLFATARNLAVDTLKGRLPQNDLGDSAAATVLDEDSDTAESVARAQELEMLNEALTSLPERCRQVFTLRRLYGLSQKEIAARLGISEKTVEAQNSIGMHKCVQFFEQRNNRASRTTKARRLINFRCATSAPQHA